jgi:hypothetical protein
MGIAHCTKCMLLAVTLIQAKWWWGIGVTKKIVIKHAGCENLQILHTGNHIYDYFYLDEI